MRLGLDFGTATTCMATVPVISALQPEIIPAVDGNALTDSLVWVSQPGRERPIVRSENRLGRCPLAVFEDGRAAFRDYWRARIKAQEEGHTWADWKDDRKEQSMLLSYFKPELADSPKPTVETVATGTRSTFDQMAQAELSETYYEQRTIANPSPDTADLVAATAAIIRRSVERAVERHGKLEMLLIGVPSDESLAGDDGASRAKTRRLEAVKLAGLGPDLVTDDFRVEVFGEAQAAGYGLDFDAATASPHAIIVDVGAGTTDVALVPYARDRGNRLVAGEPIAHTSLRFAGRNINEAIARGLLHHSRKVSDAFKAMDERSWQILMDEDVERIKRGLTHEEARYRIDFYRYAAAPDNGRWINPAQSALRKAVFLDLHLEVPEIRTEVMNACRVWKQGMSGFLERAKRELGSRDPVAVEMVGGGFKFEPIRQALRAAMRAAGMEGVPLSYRSFGNESQTVVARGLARRAVLMR